MPAEGLGVVTVKLDQSTWVQYRTCVVAYAKAEVVRIQDDLNSLFNALDIAKQGGNAEQISRFNDTISTRLGEQRALRRMCEWLDSTESNSPKVAEDECDGKCATDECVCPVDDEGN